MRLASKIGCPGMIAGLGGWLPMISGRGTGLRNYASALGLEITNGHCGTLASIFMMVEKVSGIAGMNLSELTLAIIGVGKMGTNVARVFNRKVARLLLVDIHESHLEKMGKKLEEESEDCTEIQTFLFDPKEPEGIRRILRESHMGICATSTLRNLLKVRDMPEGFISIDDSRPEAIPRDPKLERIVLEGGLLKIEGAKIDYNFGFGEDDNVFGCLGEAFLVALDKGKTLKPTVGEVEMDNFFRMVDFCKTQGVHEGDLKSGDTFISDDQIRQAFKKRFLKKMVSNQHE
jgi:predicted amino acid dehydrogenase